MIPLNLGGLRGAPRPRPAGGGNRVRATRELVVTRATGTAITSYGPVIGLGTRNSS